MKWLNNEDWSEALVLPGGWLTSSPVAALAAPRSSETPQKQRTSFTATTENDGMRQEGEGFYFLFFFSKKIKVWCGQSDRVQLKASIFKHKFKKIRKTKIIQKPAGQSFICMEKRGLIPVLHRMNHSDSLQRHHLVKLHRYSTAAQMIHQHVGAALNCAASRGRCELCLYDLLHVE